MACSEPGSDYFDVEELNYDEIIAVGQAEIVARTGATWRWHRAGVVAFVEAWPVSDDISAVSTTVWTRNDRRDSGGDCYFGQDAPEIGTRTGFYALFNDERVVEVANWSVDSWESVYATELTSQFGPPIKIEADTEAVAAALDPMVAERRVMYWLVRVVALSAFLVLSALAIARRRPFRTLPRLSRP